MRTRTKSSIWRRIYRWYIRGDYHCDMCPYCWSEWSYEGDGDAGCYIKGELADHSCRLLPPLRFLIGWPRKRKAEYWESHQYDGLPAWMENLDKKEEAMWNSLSIVLKPYELCRRDDTGKLLPVCKMDLRKECYTLYEMCQNYEDAVHPVSYPTLRKEWKDLLWKTWNRIADHFRPYFIHKKKQKTKSLF